jgi:pyridoxal phosphate enzyme (YggS family)
MPEPQAETIRERYRQVLGQVAEAALRSGGSPEAPRVVVVTKKHPPETLRAALDAGVREFGENYAEEALEKMQALGATPGVAWHMIGHVQSRKAGVVASHFDLLHSLDSIKLAGRLDRLAREAGRVLPVLLECNASGETSKFGYPAWDEAQWLALVGEAEDVLQFPGLALRGLMTMPPYAETAEHSRPFFQRLRALRDFLRQRVPGATWHELSMGTSADFVCAVEEGATLVRVGTAILGPRQVG